MSSTLSPASASDAERRAKPRLRGRRRILTVASVLLALTGGVLSDTGTAFAQPPAGYCTQTCNNPPAGVSRAEWNAAIEAANFWSNHRIDFHTVNWAGGRSYYHLDQIAGAGWPPRSTGNQWFGYWDWNLRHTEFIYYGGTYNDWNGNLSSFERGYHGGTTHNSYSTYRDRFGITHYSPYVEYDIDYYATPGSSRNARRVVRNSITGATFATFDHYSSWNYMGHF
jgi:hypothetical protein